MTMDDAMSGHSCRVRLAVLSMAPRGIGLEVGAVGLRGCPNGSLPRFSGGIDIFQAPENASQQSSDIIVLVDAPGCCTAVTCLHDLLLSVVGKRGLTRLPR